MGCQQTKVLPVPVPVSKPRPHDSILDISDDMKVESVKEEKVDARTLITHCIIVQPGAPTRLMMQYGDSLPITGPSSFTSPPNFFTPKRGHSPYAESGKVGETHKFSYKERNSASKLVPPGSSIKEESLSEISGDLNRKPVSVAQSSHAQPLTNLNRLEVPDESGNLKNTKKVSQFITGSKTMRVFTGKNQEKSTLKGILKNEMDKPVTLNANISPDPLTKSKTFKGVSTLKDMDTTRNLETNQSKFIRQNSVMDCSLQFQSDQTYSLYINKLKNRFMKSKNQSIDLLHNIKVDTKRNLDGKESSSVKREDLRGSQRKLPDGSEKNQPVVNQTLKDLGRQNSGHQISIHHPEEERQSYRSYQFSRPNMKEFMQPALIQNGNAEEERPSYRSYQLARPNMKEGSQPSGNKTPNTDEERPSYRSHQYARPGMKDHDQHFHPYHGNQEEERPSYRSYQPPTKVVKEEAKKLQGTQGEVKNNSLSPRVFRPGLIVGSALFSLAGARKLTNKIIEDPSEYSNSRINAAPQTNPLNGSSVHEGSVAANSIHHKAGDSHHSFKERIDNRKKSHFVPLHNQDNNSDYKGNSTSGQAKLNANKNLSNFTFHKDNDRTSKGKREISPSTEKENMRLPSPEAEDPSQHSEKLREDEAMTPRDKRSPRSPIRSLSSVAPTQLGTKVTPFLNLLPTSRNTLTALGEPRIVMRGLNMGKKSWYELPDKITDHKTKEENPETNQAIKSEVPQVQASLLKSPQVKEPFIMKNPISCTGGAKQ